MITLRILNLITTLNLFIANYISLKNSFGGKSNKEVSAYIEKKGKIKISPDSKAFIIWSLIFLLLGLFTLASFIPLKKYLILSNTINNKISIPYFFSVTFIVLWLILFAKKYQGKSIFFSLLAMIGILISNSYIYRSLIPIYPSLTILQKILFFFPFSIFLAWIIIAFFLNLFLSIRENKIIRQNSKLENILLLFVQLITVIISTYCAIYLKDLSFALVFAWAYYFIFKKNNTILSLTIFLINILLLLLIFDK